jgi:hypothetical protein
MKKLSVIIASVILAVSTLLLVTQGNAAADRPVHTCVPQDAWTETIEHEAVTHEETIAGSPSQWWNFAPNEPKQFDGTPEFPMDERGTWIGPHTEGGPGQDEVGLFQNGNGHGSWFYRTAGTPDQVIIVVDEEAWIEVIEHPAVVCDEEPPVDEPCTYDPNKAYPGRRPCHGGGDDSVDPVVETETRYESDKTVKVHKHESGKVTIEPVEYYSADIKEEGL